MVSDGGIWPDGLEDLLLGKEMAWALHHQGEEVRGLRFQRDGDAGPFEAVGVQVEHEVIPTESRGHVCYKTLGPARRLPPEPPSEKHQTAIVAVFLDDQAPLRAIERDPVEEVQRQQAIDLCGFRAVTRGDRGWNVAKGQAADVQRSNTRQPDLPSRQTSSSVWPVRVAA